jgi:hypothetical protein
MAMMPPGPGLPPAPAADPSMMAAPAPLITPDAVLPLVAPAAMQLQAQQEGFLQQLVAEFEQAAAVALAELMRNEPNPMGGPVAGMAGSPLDPLAAAPREDEVPY